MPLYWLILLNFCGKGGDDGGDCIQLTWDVNWIWNPKNHSALEFSQPKERIFRVLCFGLKVTATKHCSASASDPDPVASNGVVIGNHLICMVEPWSLQSVCYKYTILTSEDCFKIQFLLLSLNGP